MDKNRNYSPDLEDDEAFMEVEEMLEDGLNVNKGTKFCWDRCMKGVSGDKLTANEKSCLTTCASRLFESQDVFIKKFLDMQNSKKNFL